MKHANFLRAQKEAKRFLEACSELEERIKEDGRILTYGEITGCMESGSVKRSSMDLTRALAKMRSKK